MSGLSEAVCERHPLVVLLGPTASGKSRVAVQVAKHFGTDVLAAALAPPSPDGVQALKLRVEQVSGRSAA